MKLLGLKERKIAMARKNVVKFTVEDGKIQKSKDGTCFIVLAAMDLNIPANGKVRAGVSCPLPYIVLETNHQGPLEVHPPGQVEVPNRASTPMPFSAGEPMARVIVLDNSSLSLEESDQS